jgi:hypothetical protein
MPDIDISNVTLPGQAISVYRATQDAYQSGKVTTLVLRAQPMAAIVPLAMVTKPGALSTEDAEAIIVTAGEWWDHYGTEDPDDIMSVTQRTAICRALTLFREHTGELPSVADHSADVEAYLAEQLNRDDATLAEIAAQATRIATGDVAYEPLDDEDEPEVSICGSCGLVVRASDTGIYEDPDYPASSDEARYCDASPDHRHHPAI